MILTILYGIIGFGIMVFIHELGHFLAAKRLGIEVEAFSLGWGKRLVGFKYKGTDYRLSIIPFGGYCKMKGELPMTQGRAEADSWTPEPGSFFAASPRKRIVGGVAGPPAPVYRPPPHPQLPGPPADRGFLSRSGTGFHGAKGGPNPGSPAAPAAGQVQRSRAHRHLFLAGPAG